MAGGGSEGGGSRLGYGVGDSVGKEGTVVEVEGGRGLRAEAEGSVGVARGGELEGARGGEGEVGLGGGVFHNVAGGGGGELASGGDSDTGACVGWGGSGGMGGEG